MKVYITTEYDNDIHNIVKKDSSLKWQYNEDLDLEIELAEVEYMQYGLMLEQFYKFQDFLRETLKVHKEELIEKRKIYDEKTSKENIELVKERLKTYRESRLNKDKL